MIKTELGVDFISDGAKVLQITFEHLFHVRCQAILIIGLLNGVRADHEAAVYCNQSSDIRH